MRYLLLFVLSIGLVAQQTVNNFAVKTNLSVAGSANINNAVLTNGSSIVSDGSFTHQFSLSGRGISEGINNTIKEYGYSVYQPSITNRFIVNGDTSGYPYSSTPSIAYFDGKWFAVWSGNTSPNEGDAGQAEYMATSTDFVNWTSPFQPFNSSTTSVNPVTLQAQARQWQPNLINTGSELWCMWLHAFPTNTPSPSGFQMYFSRLTSASGKWTNTLLNLNYTENGLVYYGLFTQQPIKLRSGRVVAPVSWNATNYVSPVPSGWSTNTPFWTQEKRAGVIYTDDNGYTWKVGGATTIPGYNYAAWEPVIQENDDNTLRMFCRNLDYINFNNSQYLTTAIGYSGGESFDPLETLSFDTTSSRLGHTFQNNDINGRHLFFLNDWNSGGFVEDRYNGAIAFSRTGNADITPGVNFSKTEQVIIYPQAAIKDNSLYVVYSQGVYPRHLKSAQITPIPDANTQYILPRFNDSVNTSVEFVSGSPSYFKHTQYSSMSAVTNTSGWSSTNVSVGAWVWMEQTYGAIFDSRNLFTQKGFLIQIDANVPKVNYYASGSGQALTFSTLSVPTNQWVYLGFTLDPAGSGATAYVVRTNGTATTETLSFTNHNGFNSGTAYIGRPVPGSSVGYLRGKIRHFVASNGISATADNHRYWHGLDQSAVGASDWSGTESNPGSPFYDYNAGAANAGSNDAAWLAAWSATGINYRGSAFATTVSGQSAVAITGTGSAGIELPAFGSDQQLTWSSKLFITNKTAGYDQVFLTIGNKSNQILILSRNSNPTLIEAYSSETQRYYTLGSYRTNEWIPINLMFDRNSVWVSVQNSTASRIPVGTSTPILFLGQGYLGSRTVYQGDGIAFDVQSTGVHIGNFGRIENPNRNPIPKSISIIDSVPSLNLIDADDNTTNTIRLAGSIRYMDYNGVNSGYNDFSTGVNAAIGSSPSYKGISVGTAPSFVGVKGNGTVSTITPTTSGQILSSFSGAGYGATNTESAATGGMIVSAAENFGSTNRGTSVAFQTTPLASTIPWTRVTIDESGNITQQNLGPIYNATATNGLSGFRINVVGGSSLGLIRFQNGGNDVATFTTNGGAVFNGPVTASTMTTTLGTFTGDGSYNSLTLSNTGPIINVNATGGNAGLRVNVVGSATAAVRFQTNGTTTHTLSQDRSITAGSYIASVAGDGIQIKEGTNAKMGTATLSSGVATVSTTAVKSTSRIILTSNADGGTPGWLRVSTRTNNTSFVITSSSNADTSTVAWVIIDPAP